MSCTVNFSSPLWKHTNNDTNVELEATTIREVLDQLKDKYPELAPVICDTDGNIRPSVNVFVNDDDIQSLQGAGTAIREDDEIFLFRLLPAGKGLSWSFNE